MNDYRKQNKALIFLAIGGYLLLMSLLTMIHIYVLTMIIYLSKAHSNLLLCIMLISVTLAYLFGFIFRGMYKSNIDTAINDMGKTQKIMLALQLLGGDINKLKVLLAFIEKHNKGVGENK